MTCSSCKHYRQSRGHSVGLMECGSLAGLWACTTCNKAFPLEAWAHVKGTTMRCPECSGLFPVDTSDSPLIGFLGISTDPPPWCPGFEAIEVPKERTKPDPQRSLFE